MKNTILVMLSLGLVVANLPLGAQTSPTPAFHVTAAANGRSVCPHQDPPFLHWALRQFDKCEVTFEVNGNIPNGVNPPAAAAVVTAVKRAVKSWNDLNPAVFVLKDVSDSTNPCPPSPAVDGRNCIAWDPNFPANSTKPARTHIRIGGNIMTTGVIFEVDIQLNPRPIDPATLNVVGWTANPNCPGAPKYPFGIEMVALHELGHFLGLDHPDQSGNVAVCLKHDSNNATVMHSKYTSPCELTLHQADQDGGNYLYTADLGDAKDPPYPTKIHGASNNGPEHLFGIHTDPDVSTLAKPRYQYEWLGLDDGIIDDNPLECEALIPDRDLDDGVKIEAECEPDGTLKPSVTVRIGVKTAQDVLGNKHTYTSTPMYLNGWFDWNADGDFTDNNEHVIGKPRGSFSVTAAGTYTFKITAPDDAPCDVQSRFRLDWKEDVAQVRKVDTTLAKEKGAAQHGEVEDYVGVVELEPPPPVYCHEEVIVTQNGFEIVKLQLPCHEPQGGSSTSTASPAPFPRAGSECFETTATTGLDFDGDGIADEEIGLSGSSCVIRSDPFVDFDGLNTIETEMTVFDLAGFSPTLGPITLANAPGLPIFGRIKQSEEAVGTGFDVGPEFPADSHFEVFFVVTGDFGESDVVGPVPVTAQLVAVPPVPPIGEEPPPDEVPPDETDDVQKPGGETLGGGGP